MNFFCGIFLLILLVGFVVLFYLFGVDGFLLFCLGLGVLLFFVVLCVNWVSLVGIVLLFCIFFVKNVVLSNSMSYDFVYFFNNVLLMVFGVVFVVLVFNLVSLWLGECYYWCML